ncbi:MAG: hypothetical protein P8129_15215, partial [Anaerolineae bacterium]
MKHRLGTKKLLIVGVAAVALLLLAAGIAWAAEREPAPAVGQAFSVVGEVVNISGDEVTVEDEQGQEVGVLLVDETIQWLPGEPPTTTLSLAVGDPVLVLGRRANAEGDQASFTARLILVAERADLPRYVVRGQAVAVTAQTIVVQTGGAERAVTVARTTRLWSPQGRLASLREVKPGDRVLALGQPTELGQ